MPHAGRSHAPTRTKGQRKIYEIALTCAIAPFFAKIENDIEARLCVPAGFSFGLLGVHSGAEIDAYQRAALTAHVYEGKMPTVAFAEAGFWGPTTATIDCECEFHSQSTIDMQHILSSIT